MSQKQKAPKAPKQKKSSPKPKAPKTGGGSAASRKIVILIIILLIAAAAVLLFSKLGGCALFKSLKEYKEAYDGISGSDTQVISPETDYGTTYTPEEEQPKVDNSSDASIFDILTGCGGSAAQNNAGHNAGDRLGSISPTDAVVSYHWEQPESDEAYNSMMKEKENEFITLFTQLDDMRGELSDCRNTAQVEKNDRYIVLKAKLIGWCNGAQSFSSAALGENSQRASGLASQIASDTRSYLELYPQYVCSPDSVKQEAEELSDSIIDAVLQLDDIIG